jgi:hypothetical protein
MIIKLPIPFIYVGHREAKKVKKLTYQEKVKTDRVVLIVLFTMTIVGAVLAA